jgi:photosynthetic reaction center cytochrome c subunit
MVKADVGRRLRAALSGLAFGIIIMNWLPARSDALMINAQGAQGSGNQAAAAGGEQAEPPAEQVYKNIQALKGMPASQMRPVMSLISTSLGMKCDQCHVTDAYEKDDKRPKQTTRQMIRLTLDVNKNSFDGQTQVTCYSCHRGQERPVSSPPLGQAATPAPATSPRPVPTNLPTYDQIIEKYQQVVGSTAAFEKLKSRVMRGSLSNSRGGPFPVEMCLAAPDKMVMTTSLPNGVTMRGYNGTTGWTSAPGRQSELRGQELAQIRRSADIARPLKIKEESLSPRVMAKIALGDKETYQVSARADGQRVQLYFDVQTGLLLRRVVMVATVIGAFSEQTDFEDYREVDGVKLPFVTRFTAPDPAAGYTIEFKEIAHNVTVDDARFNPPVIQK